MSIVDDFFAKMIGRTKITLSGAVTIALVKGGVKFTGEMRSAVLDQDNGKTLIFLKTPLMAQVAIKDIEIPVPILKP